MKTKRTKTLARLVLAALVAGGAFSACSGGDGATGKQGSNGSNGAPCTVVDNGDGTSTITCGDGTSTIVGGTGTPGTSCTVVDNGDGTKTITCEDGTSVTIADGTTGATGATGATGTPGDPGLGAGETPQLLADITTSAPANGTSFDIGEQIVVTLTLTDKDGDPILLDSLARANLYMNGPREMSKTVTAAALLDASTDRSQTPHHYIDLLQPSPNLTVDGNVLTYTLQPISNEEAGTYTIALWSASKDFPLDQVFQLHDVQIGTDVVEPLIVDNCADCHEGAASAKMYLAHIDPGYSPVGNYSIDAVPVQTCKNCHNNDGYAAIRKCDDGSNPKPVAGVYTCADNGTNWSYVSDPIVRRVHGVHMGEELLSDYNTNPAYGDFEAYETVVFPFNLKNCTKCHTDDAWKTKPSRTACSACHDNIDFTTGAYNPPKPFPTKSCTTNANCVAYFNGADGVCTAGTCQCTTNAQCVGLFTGYNGVCNAGTCELQTHGGGPQADDATCNLCHGPDSGLAGIAPKHAVTPPSFGYTIEASLTAPANGTYYVAGEKPLVTMVLKQNNVPIDHTTVNQGQGWSNTYVFVNGPRDHRIPALTTAARAETTNTIDGPWNLTGQANLQLKVGFTTLTVSTTGAPFANVAAVTPDEVVTWLNADAKFSAVAFAVAKGTRVTLLARPSAARNPLEILVSPVGTVMGYAVGISNAVAASTSYAANPWYGHTNPVQDDPKVACTAASCTYQLDDVATAAPGTYTVFVSARRDPDGAGPLPQVNAEPTFVNFQVGTGTAEGIVATNCADCHGTEKMHGSYPFNVDVCGSCHDYRRAVADRLATDPVDGWGGSAAPSRSNMGFGAAPIARRVHGVHFGHYVEKPKEIHGSSDYSGVIFPQDVRNCVKCHSETSEWDEQPGRVACLGCHDSAAATAHAALQTVDPTPVDPWNGDEIESCAACHSTGAQFAPSVVHNIWAPFAPPYPRD